MTDNWANSWQPPQQQPTTDIPDALVARLVKNNLPVTNDGVLMLWQQTQKILADAKADEMEIRKTAIKIYVPNPNEGMNTVELGEGFQLKAGIKFNYKLAENTIVEACLDEITKIGNEGAFIADRLVSWTPNFLITEYRELQDKAKNGSIEAKEILKVISKFLTITDAAPSLAIKEPKVKK